MKSRFFFWIIILVTVLAVFACAPAATNITVIPTQTFSILTTTATSTFLPTIPPITPTIQIIATSRGPNLEATDPTTVTLSSGGLQLVEFFRFT